MHVDDLADACLFLMQRYSSTEFVNVGSGFEISIRDLALLIKKTIDYYGELKFDLGKPDGTPRKLMDSSKLKNLNWVPRITLEEGLKNVIGAFSERK